MFNSDNLRMVFAEENSYKNFRRIASALVRGNTADVYDFDENGNEKRISKSDMNKAMVKVFCKVLGLSEEDLNSPKKRHRALASDRGYDLYDLIEEDIDYKINEGYAQSEWFNDLVDSRNLALGDKPEFVISQNTLFLVADVSGDNHDITMQQLPEGKVLTLNTTAHAIKIGKDIDLVLLGRIDYAEMVSRIADSFVNATQNLVADELKAASDKLPAFCKMTGDLAKTTKDQFDQLIENVETLNSSDVMIVGTRVALKKLNALADVDWISDSQKEAVASTGRLGTYEGTTLLEIPQRIKVGSLDDSASSLTTLVSNDELYIIPRVENKFIKFVDEGETEIVEVTDKGALQDDFQTYEVQRRYGAAVVLGSGYFGKWSKA